MLKKVPLKNRIINGVINITVLLITFMLIESCLQILVRVETNNEVLRDIRSYTIYKNWNKADDDFWKIRYIQYHDPRKAGKLPERQILVEPHSELGWTPRKNLKMTDENGDIYTTNSMGFRSLKEYTSIDRGKYVVVIVGDSFTFGSEADDSAVWPTLLQSLDNELEVVNLGVEGYGTAQMYLMLKKYIAYFQPDLVIAAIFWDDVYRSLLSFRRYQQPKFELKDGQLYLTNIPIGRREEVYEKIKKEMRYKRVLSQIKVLNLIQNAIFQLHVRILKRSAIELRYGPAAYKELNEKIFQEMIETCQQHHSDFLLLYVPERQELYVPHYPSPVGDFLEEFAAKHNIHSLNPRRDFWENPKVFKLDKDSMGYLRKTGIPEDIVKTLKPLKHHDFRENEFWDAIEKQIGKEQMIKYQKLILESVVPPYRKGHYGKKEATILAHAVHKKITTLPSYVEVVKN